LIGGRTSSDTVENDILCQNPESGQYEKHPSVGFYRFDFAGTAFGSAAGDWSLELVSALAALACGFCSELWKLHRLTEWRYEIPSVQRFPLFKMPVLGCAGNLAFGLACASISWLLEDRLAGDRQVKSLEPSRGK
jgi:hypothetical protein